MPIDNDGVMIILSSPSGAGKTTLVKKILYPALLQSKGVYTTKPGQFSSIAGNIEDVDSIEFIDQNPIGQSSRSNPVTYITVSYTHLTLPTSDLV